MEMMEVMRARHSVRRYVDRPLPADVVDVLEAEIAACNREGEMHIQLVKDEPEAFSGFMARYGRFSGVRNYLALVGKKGPDLEEKCGYYGERLVLLAQSLGLNSCWVAMSYDRSKAACKVDAGEKLCIVIALGYGATQGVPHKSKSVEQVMAAKGEVPAWFRAGVEAALLAPTAVNQQKFKFALEDGAVAAKAGTGFYSRIDLGIVKYHFELGAGRENFRWK
ncbi:MAG: nitroreductase family protein [Clostridia bacterium]|nr:nitroreductase family protein [Clostridia bacterium]